MNENGQKLTALVATLLLVATVLGSILGSRDKLDTGRPGQTGSEPYPTLGSQRIPARLWQDPFEALHTATNAPADSSDADSERPAEARTAWPFLVTPPLSGSLARFAKAEMRLNVLGVFLESAPYPEDAEVRRRLRYAVQAALLSSKVTPVDRNHIGTAVIWRTDGRSFSPSVTNLALAFEWFERQPASRTDSSFLVLWLKEEDFSGAPLRMTAQLVEALKPRESTDLKFWLIGPRASDTLRAMAEEIPLLNSNDLSILGRHVNILSPEATAPDSVLLPNTTNSPQRTAFAARLNEGLNLTNQNLFHNWIATDGELCKRIVDELALRRLLTRLGAHDKIVLLSEGDTFYGRSLPVAFADSLKRLCGDSAASNIVLFNYLRGLEGIKPISEEPKEPSSADTPEKMLQDALKDSGEKAEGQSQKDYAQRLATLLARKDVELRRELGGVKAVGLMGNDVYDKLVLLKALRRKLPNTLFFTTDLDARLWMPPEHLNQTRNLLVASAYPIEPQEPTDHFLPFRDVYQAAVFAACKGIIKNQTTAPNQKLEGRIFEIGRNGPVELTQPVLNERTTGEPGASAGSSKVRFWVRAILGTLIGVCFTTYFAALLLGRFHASKGSKPPAKPAHAASPTELLCHAAILLTVVGATVCLAVWISRQPGEEPMAITGGVSIWLSECIRLVAIILSIYFLVTACHRARAQCATLREDFFKDAPAAPAAQTKPEASKTSFEAWIEKICINRWETPMTDQNCVDATQLFLGYEQRRLRDGPCLRVLGMALLYIGLVAGVVLLGGPPERFCVRGHLSRYFDSALLLISVLLFLAVLFCALDAARLSGKMLRSLAKGSTEWPSWLKNKRSEERCLRREHLDGLLDMQFTVEVTKETRRLMVYPFVIFFLLWLARSQLFENWSWSPSLIAVFFMNFVVAAVCWWLVRDAARSVRKTALDRLKATVNQLEGSQDENFAAPSDSAVSWSFTKRRYVKRLRKLMEEIKMERHAAFANCIQDPAYAVMLIPTGVTGIITILATQLLHR